MAPEWTLEVVLITLTAQVASGGLDEEAPHFNFVGPSRAIQYLTMSGFALPGRWLPRAPRPETGQTARQLRVTGPCRH